MNTKSNKKWSLIITFILMFVLFSSIGYRLFSVQSSDTSIIITDNPDEQKILEILLQKTASYNKQTKPVIIKKEFSQLLDDYFPLKESDSDG